MKFSELSELDRIDYIKGTVINILQELASSPESIIKYYPEPTPETFVPTKPKPGMSDLEKEELTLSNLKKEESIVKKNALAFEEYAVKLARAKEFLSNIKKKSLCMCGHCVDDSVVNKPMPNEIDFVLEVAKKRAEELFQNGKL